MHKLGGVGQVEIDQLSAVVTDGVIVSIGFAIVATGAVTKIYLVNQSGFFQVAQRVIDRCVADTGQAAARSFKDLAGGRVIVSLLNHLKHRFSLGSQLRLFLTWLHDGFRLILNPEFCQAPQIHEDFADQRSSASSAAKELDFGERSRQCDRHSSQTEGNECRGA